MKEAKKNERSQRSDIERDKLKEDSKRIEIDQITKYNKEITIRFKI